MNETAITKKPSVIIDLGEKSRKKIKRLRRGEGALYESVTDTIADLLPSGCVVIGIQLHAQH